MEVDQIQCKFPKISNCGGYASRIVSQREKMDDDEEEGEKRGSNSNNIGGSGGAADPGGGVGGLYGWPSSRIVRVSRATGGKDRHSKVLTSKGLRDRRVRLSVNTAIQFYDLQDRLGYDQPSKAVEWLLSAAADSIAELPPMNSPFPFTNKLPIEERKMSVASGADHHHMITLDSVMDGGGGGLQQEAAAAAAGSSSSETSKGSGLSISRSENRFRARERAKERALEKERENDESSYVASFTELLSGGGISSINGGGGGGGGVAVDKDVSVCRDQTPINNGNSDHQSTFFNKFPMDYFNNGISVPPAALQFSAAADHQPELQLPFSFASENLVSANSSAINRGTLQSNSSSSSLQFPPNIFTSAAAPAGNYRHFFPGFDGRLQLYYGDTHGGNDGRHSDPKRKDKP